MPVPKFTDVRNKRLGESKEAEKREREQRYNEIVSDLLKQEGVSYMSDLGPEKASELTKEARRLLDTNEDPNRGVREDREKKEQFLQNEFSMKKEELSGLSMEAINELMQEARTRMIEAGDERAKVADRNEFVTFAHAYMGKKLGEAYAKEDADAKVESFVSAGYEDWEKAKSDLVSKIG